MCNSVVAEGSGRGSLGARGNRGGIEAGRWVACGGMKWEPCGRWRGLRENVLLGRVALGSLGEVAVGMEARCWVRPANGIQCGRGGGVLGGVECAALRVVCRERCGIMRTCCGQQHGWRCWCERCGSHRGGGVA
jgi:hypothetical protein